MNAANMPYPSDGVQSRALPQRIVFIRQRFTQFGGGELVLDRTITATLARGMRVSLLSRGWTARTDVDFVRCDPPRFPRFLRERRFASAACRLVDDLKDAIVQSHERLPCCDIFRAGDGVHAAYLEQRTRGLPRVSRFALAANPFHRMTLRIEREMFASSRLKAVIVNSSMVADEIVRHFGFERDRIYLVPNGIDLGRFGLAARERYRAEVRKQLSTAGTKPVALFVGSGYQRKGLDAAINAISECGVDAELWIVGSDSRASAYLARAARAGIPREHIRLIGPASDPLPYYAAADVLVLPSIYDPFPSTVLEALACGLPCVTSTACGASETVAELDPGLVADAQDISRLANGVRRAFDLAAKPETASAAHAIASQFTIDRMIDGMLSVYAKLGARA
jgi:UDP-glucose:(heptosyl)LPS alpha-1,3-glucosyltransferase